MHLSLIWLPCSISLITLISASGTCSGGQPAQLASNFKGYKPLSSYCASSYPASTITKSAFRTMTVTSFTVVSTATVATDTTTITELAAAIILTSTELDINTLTNTNTSTFVLTSTETDTTTTTLISNATVTHTITNYWNTTVTTSQPTNYASKRDIVQDQVFSDLLAQNNTQLPSLCACLSVTSTLTTSIVNTFTKRLPTILTNYVVETRKSTVTPTLNTTLTKWTTLTTNTSINTTATFNATTIVTATETSTVTLTATATLDITSTITTLAPITTTSTTTATTSAAPPSKDCTPGIILQSPGTCGCQYTQHCQSSSPVNEQKGSYNTWVQSYFDCAHICDTYWWCDAFHLDPNVVPIYGQKCNIWYKMSSFRQSVFMDPISDYGVVVPGSCQNCAKTSTILPYTTSTTTTSPTAVCTNGLNVQPSGGCNCQYTEQCDVAGSADMLYSLTYAKDQLGCAKACDNDIHCQAYYFAGDDNSYCILYNLHAISPASSTMPIYNGRGAGYLIPGSCQGCSKDVSPVRASGTCGCQYIEQFGLYPTVDTSLGIYVYASSLSACMNACDNNPSCVTFTFTGDAGSACLLYSFQQVRPYPSQNPLQAIGYLVSGSCQSCSKVAVASSTTISTTTTTSTTSATPTSTCTNGASLQPAGTCGCQYSKFCNAYTNDARYAAVQVSNLSDCAKACDNDAQCGAYWFMSSNADAMSGLSPCSLFTTRQINAVSCDARAQSSMGYVIPGTCKHCSKT